MCKVWNLLKRVFNSSSTNTDEPILISYMRKNAPTYGAPPHTKLNKCNCDGTHSCGSNCKCKKEAKNNAK